MPRLTRPRRAGAGPGRSAIEYSASSLVMSEVGSSPAAAPRAPAAPLASVTLALGFSPLVDRIPTRERIPLRAAPPPKVAPPPPHVVAGSSGKSIVSLRKRRTARVTGDEVLQPPKKMVHAEDAHAEADALATAVEGRTEAVASDARRKLPSPGNLIKTAMAGAVSCATSTFVFHPMDTLKTKIQGTASAAGGESLFKTIPKLGASNLYRGWLPATVGSGVGNGIRTLTFEAAIAAATVMGLSTGVQMQGLASFVGTTIGTCSRVPCEVVKQRLQIGAKGTKRSIRGAVKTAASGPQGARGLFRGTAITVAREAPFYVIGMVGYQQLKAMYKPKENWEYIMLGGVAGALASLTTNPSDIIKTRIMTAPPGAAVTVGSAARSIIAKEGVGALFKGALPRMACIIPVGAMNLGGYDLAKRALAAKEAEETAHPARVADTEEPVAAKAC